MKVVKSLKAVAAGVITVLGLSAGNANAIFLYQGAALEDDDTEYVLDSQGNIKTSGALAVGDRLRATIEINRIFDPFNLHPEQLLSTGGQPELTGISEIEVAAINVFGPIAQIVFKPSTSFATELAGLAGGVAADYAGAMVGLWTDGTPDLTLADQTTSCLDISTCEDNATNGSLWAVAGFSGDADNVWVTNFFPAAALPTLLTDLATSNASFKPISYNYNLDVVVNNTGYDFGPVNGAGACLIAGTCAGDGLVQVVGSGDVLGGQGLTNGYIARSDFDFGVNAIPEPSSLALLAGCVLGAGVVARRRTKS